MQSLGRSGICVNFGGFIISGVPGFSVAGFAKQASLNALVKPFSFNKSHKLQIAFRTPLQRGCLRSASSLGVALSSFYSFLRKHKKKCAV